MAKYRGISKRKVLCNAFDVKDSYIGNALQFEMKLERHEQIRLAEAYLSERMLEVEEQLKQEVIEKFVEKS